MIKDYYQFVNEGLISSAKELINYKTIKENDKISKKYLDMIYQDWEKKKDLLKVLIACNSGSYSNFTYRINDDPTIHVGLSNRNKNDIEVKLTLITSGSWPSDISGARISATTFRPYEGNLNLFGRDMKSNKLIVSENGIKEDIYDYINISSKQVKDMIDFFKSKFIERYPSMKGGVYFNPTRVLEIDKELSKKMIQIHNDKRKKYEEEYESKKSKAQEVISLKAKYNNDYIEDLFMDLIDDDIRITMSIFYKDNDHLIAITNYANIPFVVTKQLDDIQHNQQHLLKDGKIYYSISFTYIDKNYEEDEVDDYYDEDGGVEIYQEENKFNLDKVIKLINSTRIKYLFNVIDYGKYEGGDLYGKKTQIPIFSNQDSVAIRDVFRNQYSQIDVVLEQK